MKIKAFKKWLAGIVTALLIAALFGVIFIKADLVQPTPSFFLELSAVLSLVLMMKLFWYDYAEDKRLSEDDIKNEKESYYAIVDENIQDSNDLEKFLKILNQENKDHYISNKMGCRTAKNLAVKNKWICFWHPSYKKMTAEEIGQHRYNKLLFKYMRKADKLRPIKAEEIMALSDSEVLYDSKNHLKEKKRAYQISTTILSFLISTLLACLGLREILLNWVNVFRYIMYLAAMAYTIGTTVISAYRRAGIETFDHLNRLKFIIDKYATYKAKEGVKEDVSDGTTVCGLFERIQ